MHDDIRELLGDILIEAQSVKDFTGDHTLDTYKADKKTRFAVERCFEIIGEALTRISKIDPAVLDAIRDCRSIRSFRNLLVHAYDYVDDTIVWGIIEGDLGNLIADVTELTTARPARSTPPPANE